MYDIIIIGAGPAGLTAALYACRANKKVLVLEAKSYGGQIINASVIENYPGIPNISGFDYATNLYNQVKNLGCEIKFQSVIRVDEDNTVFTNDDKYKADAIIIATGASNRKLNIPLEDKFIGHGVSYCATCDGHFYKDKVVAVVGGGNTALEDALYLADLASDVYLIHRRDEFRGENKYLEEIKKKSNIKLVLNSNVTKLIGGDTLESIEMTNKDGVVDTLEISGLFIAIGQIPLNQIFSNLIDLDENGYIKSIDGVHTNRDKIYVAGDTRVKELSQLTTAVSDGALAATVAIKELNN